MVKVFLGPKNLVSLFHSIAYVLSKTKSIINTDFMNGFTTKNFRLFYVQPKTPDLPNIKA